MTGDYVFRFKLLVWFACATYLALTIYRIYSGALVDAVICGFISFVFGYLGYRLEVTL